ncbi:MAG: cytochrome C oxidase subunit IV family protein [Crocinitomicaceae bacterium]|nr:cytochrome C oxidase subunit IV family protein [Crocinitomicaceae bacterium]
MERDDIVEYSLHAHHSDEDGKKIRKKIWIVTAILSIITIIEVGVGIALPKAEVSTGLWTAIKYGYILLTLVKAGYIVMVFMHLGDEVRTLRRMILWPYAIFILYLIFICLTEASSVHNYWSSFH